MVFQAVLATAFLPCDHTGIQHVMVFAALLAFCIRIESAAFHPLAHRCWDSFSRLPGTPISARAGIPVEAFRDIIRSPMSLSRRFHLSLVNQFLVVVSSVHRLHWILALRSSTSWCLSGHYRYYDDSRQH